MITQNCAPFIQTNVQKSATWTSLDAVRFEKLGLNQVPTADDKKDKSSWSSLEAFHFKEESTQLQSATASKSNRANDDAR